MGMERCLGMATGYTIAITIDRRTAHSVAILDWYSFKGLCTDTSMVVLADWRLIPVDV